jgi:hypothetical protein
MSRSDSVSLVSRVFGLLLLSTALMELTYLPERIFAFAHVLEGRSIAESTANTAPYWSTLSYLIKANIISVAFLCLRIVGFLVAARAFWSCGPRVRALLMPKQEETEATESSVP